MLNLDDTILVVIDVQESLVRMLNKQEPVVKASSTLVRAMDIMGIPIIITEQYPQGLGKTVYDISTIIDNSTCIIEKTAFSAMQTNEFVEKIRSYNKKNVIICGIETHICVYQTVVELLNAGYNTVVAKDACASRSTDCFKTGIELMKEAGAVISNVEVILFELLKTSKNPHFKAIQLLIK